MTTENLLEREEELTYGYQKETVYRADLELSGREQGEMKLQAVFSAMGQGPVRLLFDPDENGKPKSRGYSSYRGNHMENRGYGEISLKSGNRPVCPLPQKACISLSYFSFLGVTLHQTSS